MLLLQASLCRARVSGVGERPGEHEELAIADAEIPRRHSAKAQALVEPLRALHRGLRPEPHGCRARRGGLAQDCSHQRFANAASASVGPDREEVEFHFPSYRQQAGGRGSRYQGNGSEKRPRCVLRRQGVATGVDSVRAEERGSSVRVREPGGDIRLVEQLLKGGVRVGTAKKWLDDELFHRARRPNG